MTMKWIRGAAGGAVAYLVASIISNVLFFQLGRDILFENALQSDKVNAVLFEMEPLPLMFTNGLLYLAIAAGIGAIHGLVFTYIEPSLPRANKLRRGIAFAVILWAIMALFFEFHTPFNMFGEPLALVAVELFFWAIVLLTEGLILSYTYGESRVEARSATRSRPDAVYA